MLTYLVFTNGCLCKQIPYGHTAGISNLDNKVAEFQTDTNKREYRQRPYILKTT